jgi:hypothetical protein
MLKLGARHTVRFPRVCALAILACTLAVPAFARTFWELEPVKDPSIAIGTYTAVGGRTSPDGVFFVLKNNKDTMPVEVTLLSTDPNAKLHLATFKDSKPFLDKETDAKGALTIRLRTADEMNFKVSGPAAAAYQLSVWRGPEIKLPQPGAIVSMESVVGNNAPTAPAAASSPAASAPSPAATQPAQTGSDGGTSVLIYVLLAGILIALCVIAFLVYRGQQMRRGS